MFYRINVITLPVVFVLHGNMHMIIAAFFENWRWNFNELIKNRNYISKKNFLVK